MLKCLTTVFFELSYISGSDLKIYSQGGDKMIQKFLIFLLAWAMVPVAILHSLFSSLFTHPVKGIKRTWTILTAVGPLHFARVQGPLFSLNASGSIGKAITYAAWKGRNYVREWFIPENPQSDTQVNVRTAFTLAVAYYGTKSADYAAWDLLGDLVNKSGFNVFMTRAMNEYMDQLGSSTTPVSVSYTGTVPDEVWTWSDS
jgi:hypothetical protein